MDAPRANLSALNPRNLRGNHKWQTKELSMRTLMLVLMVLGLAMPIVAEETTAVDDTPLRRTAATKLLELWEQHEGDPAKILPLLSYHS